MGDPKKQRKTYETPGHPWKSERIDEESKLQKEYGLKNKKEIWRMNSILKSLKDQAKKLISRTGEQAEKEELLFRKRLEKMGLIGEGMKMENVLDLGLKDILERRLQTQVFRRGLAKSITQARQFITHGHITISSRKVSIPSYILMQGEEALILFRQTSALSDAEHPERKHGEKKEEAPAAKAEEEPKEEVDKDVSPAKE
ncbi:MAG TPA: 30S ribosomal protein S4 [Nanoarchaeota archaeon]|nr:30S ribosomal protein S4 [Nanoarchaeota archaeon]